MEELKNTDKKGISTKRKIGNPPMGCCPLQ